MDARELKSIPLFASLSDTDLTQLAHWVNVIELPEKTSLVEEGGLAYEFLVMMTGTAEVTVDGDQVRTLGPGDVVGEIGLLSPDLRRTATVKTTSPVGAIVMTGPRFRAMMRELPVVAERVRETIRGRLR
jgi:CRP-like cAMP-binding protein